MGAPRILVSFRSSSGAAAASAAGGGRLARPAGAREHAPLHFAAFVHPRHANCRLRGVSPPPHAPPEFSRSRSRFMEIDGRNRVIIEGVTPEIDGGRFAAKRVAGDVVTVEADIFADGHDLISAVVRYRRPGESEWREQAMKALVNDRWRGEFPLEALGVHRFTIDAWIDHFLSWHGDLKKRVDAGQDVAVELLVGRAMIEAAASRAKGRDQKRLRSYLEDLDGEGTADERA